MDQPQNKASRHSTEWHKVAYHHRMRILVMGGRKYQAEAWERISQFMSMVKVMFTARF